MPKILSTVLPIAEKQKKNKKNPLVNKLIGDREVIMLLTFTRIPFVVAEQMLLTWKWKCAGEILLATKSKA